MKREQQMPWMIEEWRKVERRSRLNWAVRWLAVAAIVGGAVWMAVR